MRRGSAHRWDLGNRADDNQEVESADEQRFTGLHNAHKTIVLTLFQKRFNTIKDAATKKGKLDHKLSAFMLRPPVCKRSLMRKSAKLRVKIARKRVDHVTAVVVWIALFICVLNIVRPYQTALLEFNNIRGVTGRRTKSKKSWSKILSELCSTEGGSASRTSALSFPLRDDWLIVDRWKRALLLNWIIGAPPLLEFHPYDYDFHEIQNACAPPVEFFTLGGSREEEQLGRGTGQFSRGGTFLTYPSSAYRPGPLLQIVFHPAPPWRRVTLQQFGVASTCFKLFIDSSVTLLSSLQIRSHIASTQSNPWTNFIYAL
ncbi:hypothetical protein C8R44DRAFT_743016 [Mycena epipterygia]|nr:hypothetical protein C8R44DRAFT_743016 [Mycena epipterygia]